MNIAKPGKITLLILTVLPIFYMLFFMAFIFITMVTTISTSKAPSKDMFDFFPVLFIMHFAIILVSFGLIAFYIYYLFKTDRVEKDKKALWAVVLLLGSFFAMPVFWYLYIWREPQSVLASEQSELKDM
jgi:energy-coupling factor transporter transmembrane protein EcfT